MRLLLLAAAAAAASIPAVSFADSASCRPRAIQSATSFPTRSQVRGLIAVQFQNNEY
ncbi:MAG: hypothetical protein ACREXP_13795 [Steroidobacteraceae bacterium]